MPSENVLAAQLVEACGTRDTLPMHLGVNAYLTADRIARFHPSTIPPPPFPGYVSQPVKLDELPVGFPIRVKYTRAKGQTTVELVNAPLAHFYGTGEHAGRLLRNGTRKVLWNTDSYGYSDRSQSLYQSHPFVLGLTRARGVGDAQVRAFGVIVETTHRCVIDLTRPGRARFEVHGPSPAVTVILRDTPQEIISTLANLTGRMPLPPRWALGYHQCRYTYEPDSRVLEVARLMREKWIPCDCIWLDIDVMDGYRCFTFDSKKFPNPAAMVRELHERHFKVVCMVDPGIKVDDAYPTYTSGHTANHFVTTSTGKEYHGKVWPGACAFPDFTSHRTRQWFTGLYADLLRVGIDGVWNDMNEPAVFGVTSKTMPEDNLHAADEDLGGPDTHARYHNIYGMQMARASLDALKSHSPGQRPFLLTRAGFLGSQRYAATWTGDNRATESHFRWTIPMVLNLGLSGQPFCGPDIGGFVGDTDPELFARWMGIGALMPFCRSHKDKGTKDHEPWALTEDVERVCRLGLERRYRLLPYLYTVFEEAVRTGLPIVRPLFFAEPFDPRLRTVDDAFLLGRDILVVSPGLRMFDPGSHPAFQRWKPFELTAEHPLLPRCYLRPGSVLPVGPVMQHTGERPTDPLTLYVNLDQSGQAEGRLYEDDGESLNYARGEYRVTSFSVIAAGTGVSVTSTFQFNGFEPAARRIETVLL